MSVILKNEENNLKANILGVTETLKRGGYKPSKEKLSEPLPEGAVMYTFCNRCNRYYPIDYERAQDFSRQFSLELQPKEKLKKFFIEYDGCVCCRFYNPKEAYKNVRLRSVSDIV